DYLTDSINYQPVTTENKANKTAGPKEANNSAGAARASSTNYVNTASTPVNTASPLRNVSVAGQSYLDLLTYANQDDYQIPSLEDIYDVSNGGIFTSKSYDDEGAVADFTNLETIVNEELLQFKTQQVWILVDLPFGKKVIGTKWVYKNKKDKRDVVVRNKAWLVAHAHRQEEGIEYDEVFAPVARIEAIKIFLAFASYIGFIVYQMDVKSASLYGKIDEEVYVSQPPYFIHPKFPKKVKKKKDGIFISQDKYVAEILKKFDFMSVKTASTPIETKKPLVQDGEAADVDVHLYRYMIGSLMYLTA
nr:putative ribonuclease H-like domain-containing protein [Tanacetum cinerariifolium]